MSQRSQRTSIAYLNSPPHLPRIDAMMDRPSSPNTRPLRHTHPDTSQRQIQPADKKTIDSKSKTKFTERSNQKRKKRKTMRACNHCQRSHLTCDDSRPCLRCVNKGIADTCVDGQRKKAKYLIDAEEELLAEQRSTSPPASPATESSSVKKLPQPAPLSDLLVRTDSETLSSIPERQQQQQQQQQHPQQQQQQFRRQHQPPQLQSISPISSFPPPLPSPVQISSAATSVADLAAATPAILQQPPSLDTSALQATPSTANFGSEAINLEYAILSSMLSYPVFSSGPMSAPGDSTDAAANRAVQQQHQGITLGVNNTVSIPNSLWAAPPTQPLSALLPSQAHHISQQNQQHQSPAQAAQVLNASINNGAISNAASMQEDPSRLESIVGGNSSSISLAHNGLATSPQYQYQHQHQQQNAQYAHQNRQRQESWPRTALLHGQSNGILTVGPSALVRPSPPPLAQIVADETHNPLSRPPTTDPAVYGLNPVYSLSPAEVYSSVTEPYKYYNGFHFFFRHISSRMDKKNIMRVSRAIAHFRPSLVALLRNLTREDLIFMEKSFQRALLEYEKLIGFIGTPAVVWRRSGEIALVGKEFSILTQWDRQQLINGNRFIFELMDVESAVVYWEQFAVHAFENSEHAVMSECKLVRPDGSIVPCAFSFTVKRDLFGIPMAIIGNFLPIL
ncbi:hypothetical protein BX070DRAFT_102849 [Coemansia spiralis]|nr:hypothetical protein BX070DRAFT_102849 [Coemansia spiralis]